MNDNQDFVTTTPPPAPSLKGRGNVASTLITVAYGDGVGPEIMEAALHVLREAGAQMEIDSIQIGERIYNMEAPWGILPSGINKLARSRILLKGPTVIPTAENYKTVTAAICDHFTIAEHTPESVNDFPPIQAIAYVGEQCALFEPVQEHFPEIAGKNKANPASALLAATLLLRHIGQPETADIIHTALLSTLESGIHTRDLYQRGKSRKKVSTSAFTEAVLNRLAKPLQVALV